jgi:hypothetical protein
MTGSPLQLPLVRSRDEARSQPDRVWASRKNPPAGLAPEGVEVVADRVAGRRWASG